MLERFDHRPMLTAALTLTTTVLLVVVVTLLITSTPAVSPPSVGGSNPGAGAAPANVDAGGESYGWPNNTKPAQPAQHSQMSDGERHAEIVRNTMH
jgi:hypothetical protein